MPDLPGRILSKAEKGESEEKEKPVAIAKRIETSSASLEDLHSSLTRKSVSEDRPTGTLVSTTDCKMDKFKEPQIQIARGKKFSTLKEPPWFGFHLETQNNPNKLRDNRPTWNE